MERVRLNGLRQSSTVGGCRDVVVEYRGTRRHRRSRRAAPLWRRCRGGSWGPKKHDINIGGQGGQGLGTVFTFSSKSRGSLRTVVGYIPHSMVIGLSRHSTSIPRLTTSSFGALSHLRFSASQTSQLLMPRGESGDEKARDTHRPWPMSACFPRHQRPPASRHNASSGEPCFW